MNLFLTIALLMAYTVNPKIHQFETALITAGASHLIANGVYDPAKQQDGKELVTPRVELKVGLDAYGPNTAPHRWINQSDRTLWPDTRDGKLYVRVVTRRGADGQDHYGIVATIRSLFQSVSALNGRMELHSVERIVEGSSGPEIAPAEHHDATILSFDFRIRILFDTKTADIFPTV